MVAAGVWAKL